MEMSYFNTYIVLFCILWSLILVTKKSILMCLISLEFLHFFLFLLYYWPIPHTMNSLSIIVMLLCFAASGAALGLSILITMSRQSGSDLIKANL
uniref:NADH-ubiquinone oxidoreductase chain 4L n=2 Tax=Euhadra awaensis TaxID=244803 RepID=Q75Z51_9EUPU|nr:NADH dehydrogenase subunit 4L [Euhadra awaensis awaensis]BAC99251.1 NADH dehydrogenase subunit 4L [Euhadra awaensis vortex]